jgi:acyl carrier protein
MRRPSPLFADLPEVRASAGDGAGRETGQERSLARDLLAVPEAGRPAVVLDVVRTEAAVVLGHRSPETVSPDVAFRDVGFDSLTAVELCNRLKVATGLPLPATLVFEHPNPRALSRHLLGELLGTTPPFDDVLAELDRLEYTLLAAADGEPDRARLAARVRALLAKVAEPAGEENAVEALESASDGEIFDFINRELGRSD